MRKNISFLLIFAALSLVGCGKNNSSSIPSGSKDSSSEIIESSSSSETPTSFSELSGAGTEANPFLIQSKDDLFYLSREVLKYTDTKDVYFEQTKNIDVGGEVYEPIGTYGIPFEGIYNGKEFEIQNIEIETEKSFQGIFGFVTGIVKNIKVSGSISVHLNSQYSHSYVGSIAGAINNGGKILSCSSSCVVVGDSYVGGICGGQCYTDHLGEGDIHTLIDGCEFSGLLVGNGLSALYENAKYFGGIVGHSNGAIKNCTNKGEIRCAIDQKTEYVGGICGYTFYSNKYWKPTATQMEELATENCVNEGKVTGNHAVGGICGNSATPVKNCINRGEIIGNKSTGGICGVNGLASAKTIGLAYMLSCENYGKITNNASANLGGVAGYSYLPISNCKNYGDVDGSSGSNRVGGIAGYSVNKIENSFNEGDVVGFYSVGGVCGNNAAGSIIDNCVNLGEVTSTTRGYYIGGIAGYSTSSVTKSKNHGNVTGDHFVGGLIGKYKTDKENIFVTQNETKGNVTSTMEASSDGYPNAYVGGLIGQAETGYATDVSNNTLRYDAEHGIVSAPSNCFKVDDLFGEIGGLAVLSNNSKEAL